MVEKNEAGGVVKEGEAEGAVEEGEMKKILDVGMLLVSLVATMRHRLISVR